MIDAHEDQAAGLRRLFRRTPPHVLALFCTGHQAAANALRVLHSLARGAQPVLVLDETRGPHALGPLLQHADERDLLHAVDGRTAATQLVQPIAGVGGRIAIHAAAMALPLLDDQRRQALIGTLQTLQQGLAYLPVLAQADGDTQPSPFVFAAPRRVVVVEASGRGATEAYALIKRLANAGAGSVQVAVSRARSRDDAGALFRRLDDLVRRRIGIPMRCLGEIERDDLGTALMLTAPQSAAPQHTGFLQRLAGPGYALAG